MFLVGINYCVIRVILVIFCYKCLNMCNVIFVFFVIFEFSFKYNNILWNLKYRIDSSIF